MKKLCFRYAVKFLLLGVLACVLIYLCLYDNVNIPVGSGQPSALKNVVRLVTSSHQIEAKVIKDTHAVLESKVKPINQPLVLAKTSNNRLPKNQNISRISANIKNASKKKVTVHLTNASMTQVGQDTMSSDVNKTISRKTVLDDIFIGVKTGSVYHKKRLDLLLETWVTQTQNQTYFFTDVDDEEYQNKTNGHLINTHCPGGHSRNALCCKMGAIFDTYFKLGKRWFCHLDDDNYLNPSQLVSWLQGYNPEKDDIYVGGSSLKKSIETKDKARPGQNFSFRFGTGGAGFCISKSLAMKMKPYASDGGFVNICERIRWPDDMAVGYISEVLLNTSLIVENRFNSHIRALGNMRPEELTKQITLSYKIENDFVRVMYLPKGVYNVTEDPTRFRSLHCMLYPGTRTCPKG